MTVVPTGAAELAALDVLVFGPEAWSRDVWRGSLDAPYRQVLLEAAPGGGVAGFLVLAVVPDLAEVERVGVVAEYRRAGVASRLLAAAAGRAAAAGAYRLTLEVRADNAAARSCYAAAGFVESGRRPRYYAGGTVDAVLLDLPIGRLDQAEERLST